ncbi:DUF2628 domain-containing protein [Pseudoxanthobacter sp.]|uniref:DUF2628 domain-containing protein n=1 Tax=Pseudoxanthobacter sp. TaxID=1925742 RepID=UPI002FE0BCDB
MRRFSVMEPPASGDGSRDADRVAFVREGFSWVALIVPALWLLCGRMWLAFAVFIVADIALAVLGTRISEDAGMVLSLALNVVVAFEAAGLKRWHLTRRGFREVAVIEAPGRAAAEQRYFAARLAARVAATPAGPAPAPARRHTFSLPEAGEPVVGLFPRPERSS